MLNENGGFISCSSFGTKLEPMAKNTEAKDKDEKANRKKHKVKRDVKDTKKRHDCETPKTNDCKTTITHDNVTTKTNDCEITKTNDYVPTKNQDHEIKKTYDKEKKNTRDVNKKMKDDKDKDQDKENRNNEHKNMDKEKCSSDLEYEPGKRRDPVKSRDLENHRDTRRELDRSWIKRRQERDREQKWEGNRKIGRFTESIEYSHDRRIMKGKAKPVSLGGRNIFDKDFEIPALVRS